MNVIIDTMQITGHELTAASSAVAALAIIGGYLGVRSANRNAVAIAREERSSKRQEELTALKRAAYVEYESALNQLAAAAQRTQFAAGGGVMGMKPVDEEVRERRDDQRQAQVLAQNRLAAVELLADPDLAGRARAVYTATDQRLRWDDDEYRMIRAGLLAALQEDLSAIPRAKEITQKTTTS